MAFGYSFRRPSHRRSWRSSISYERHSCYRAAVAPTSSRATTWRLRPDSRAAVAENTSVRFRLVGVAQLGRPFRLLGRGGGDRGRAIALIHADQPARRERSGRALPPQFLIVMMFITVVFGLGACFGNLGQWPDPPIHADGAVGQGGCPADAAFSSGTDALTRRRAISNAYGVQEPRRRTRAIT